MALSGIMTRSLLAADTSRQIAHVQQSVKNKMDAHAGVLGAEIKLDEARGGDVTKKKEELDEINKKATSLGEATIKTLTSANEELEKAAKEDKEAEKAAEKKKAKKAAKKKEAEKIAEKKAEKKAEEDKLEKTLETTDGIHIDNSSGRVFEGTSVNVVVDTVTPSVIAPKGVGNEVDIKA